MKLLAQPVDNAEESLLHSSHAGSKIFSDFLTGQTFLMLHDEHQFLSRRNLIESLHDLLDYDVVVRDAIRSDSREAYASRDVHRRRKLLPPLVAQKGVHHDPAQPGMKRRFSPKTPDRAIRAEENFLNQIFGVVMIAAEPQGQGVHHPLVSGYQKAEGIHVTVLGSGDKVILRKSHPRFRFL